MKIFNAFKLTVFLYLIEIIIYFLIPYIFGNYDDFIENYDIIPYDNLQGISYLFARIIAYLFMFMIIKDNKIYFTNIYKYKGHDFFIIPFLAIIAIGLQTINLIFTQSKNIINYLIHSNYIIPNYHFNGMDLELVYRSIAAIILSPILEELFFRKILFTQLMDKYSVKTSIIVSSICFASIHIDNPISLIPTFILGIISVLIYHKTKKIRYSILLHLFFNLYWFFMVILGEKYINWIFGLKFNYAFWLIFIFGLSLTLIGMKKITSANNI